MCYHNNTHRKVRTVDNYTIILIYKMLYAYLGKRENARWRKFRVDWLRANNNPTRCRSCNKKVDFKNDGLDRATLDHIIPKTAIYAMELTDLLYEPSNFELMCKGCNMDKANTVPEVLPPLLKQRFQEAVDRQNNRL